MIRNDPKEFKNQSQELNGIYRGVVEDNIGDPEKRGRCKIRVFGIHSENKKDVPTENLPWFEPALGLFGGSVSGVGQWTVPVQGSHVYLFFENGHILKGRFFASSPGKPESQNHGFKNNEGFSDPDKEFPKENYLNEPDWNRLSRDETVDTILDQKNQNLESGVGTALGSGTWDEPDPYYLKNSSKYPDNVVIATQAGIVLEIDSSDNPRLHIYHPSNSYIETDDLGNTVIKNAGNKFEIILKDENSLIKGNSNININKNKNEKIGVDCNKEVGGNETSEITGDKTHTISGKTEITSTGVSDINGSNVNLNKKKGTMGNIVTTNHVCGITGLPHPDGSVSCFASKT